MLQIAIKAEQQVHRKNEVELQRQTVTTMQYSQEYPTSPSSMLGNFSSVRRQKAQVQALGNINSQLIVGNAQMYGDAQSQAVKSN